MSCTWKKTIPKESEAGHRSIKRGRGGKRLVHLHRVKRISHEQFEFVVFNYTVLLAGTGHAVPGAFQRKNKLSLGSDDKDWPS